METLKQLLNEIYRSSKKNNKSRGAKSAEGDHGKIKEVTTRNSLLDIFVCASKMESIDQRLQIICTFPIIMATAEDNWVLQLFNKNGTSTKDIDNVMRTVFSCGFVPTLEGKEHYSYEKSDFPGVNTNVCSVLSMVVSFLYRIGLIQVQNSEQNLTKNITMQIFAKYVLIVTLENLSEHPWTCQKSVSFANLSKKLVCEAFGITNENISKLLNIRLSENSEMSSPKDTFFCQILDSILPKLNKENWKKNPGSLGVYVNCLMNTKFPNLSEHLDKVLPTALSFVDDYMLENKILGVNCLRHIVDNVSKEELRWYGRADVVYEALKHQLYSREPTLLEVAIPANMAIVDVVDTSDSQTGHCRSISKRDELLERLLRDAEGESLLVLRRLYTQHLSSIVNIQGVNAVRHLKHIIKVSSEYLEVFDGPTENARFNIINLLKTTIRAAWPRIPNYTSEILQMLVKVLIDMTMDRTTTPDHVKKFLYEEIGKCMVLLKHLDDDKVSSHLICLVSTDIPEKCKHTLQFVIDAELDGLS